MNCANAICSIAGLPISIDVGGGRLWACLAVLAAGIAVTAAGFLARGGRR